MSEAISIQLAELSKERAAMNDLQAAVQKLYDEHGSGYCFPSDLIWKYLTGLQPNGTAKPGLIKALDRENYIVSTGRMTKAVSGTRKGSPTKEDRKSVV